MANKKTRNIGLLILIIISLFLIAFFARPANIYVEWQDKNGQVQNSFDRCNPCGFSIGVENEGKFYDNLTWKFQPIIRKVRYSGTAPLSKYKSRGQVCIDAGFKDADFTKDCGSSACCYGVRNSNVEWIKIQYEDEIIWEWKKGEAKTFTETKDISEIVNTFGYASISNYDRDQQSYSFFVPLKAYASNNDGNGFSEQSGIIQKFEDNCDYWQYEEDYYDECNPTPPPIPPSPPKCTDDVKECWDGSFVGRIAPDCEFAECPPIITPVLSWWDKFVLWLRGLFEWVR